MDQERVAHTRARRRAVVVWDGRQIGGLVARPKDACAQRHRRDDDCKQQKNDETQGYTSVGDGPTYDVGEPGSRMFVPQWHLGFWNVPMSLFQGASVCPCGGPGEEPC